MLQTSLTVRASCSGTRCDGRALALLATTHGQVGLPVEAVHALVIDPGKLRAQQIVDAPVAKAPAHMRDLHDLLVQILRGLIGLRRMAAAVAGEPHKTARAAFGQMVFADHDPDRLAPGLWG
jgi:hypothetical protein